MNAQVRALFPALARTLDGRHVAYFDGPGGTQVPQCVVDAVADYLLRHNANEGWSFRTSIETDTIVRRARAAAAAFVNAASVDEILFGANMTTLTFHLARAIGRTLVPGNEVIVTDLDHHANIDPWVALARDYGAVIKRVPLRGGRPQIDVDAYEAMLTPRTRLVAVGLSSNAFGTINPVARIAAAAHRAGALVFVDAVHAAAHAPIDVAELGADMLAFSAYKVYGPHIGIAYCRDELLEQLPFPRLAPQAPKGAKRAESGTQNFEGIAGTGAAIEFLCGLSAPNDLPLRERIVATMKRLGRHEETVFHALAEGLRALPGVRLYEPPPDVERHPTLAFNIAGIAAPDVAARLSDEHAVFVSHGNFYAATALAQIAPQANANGGVVRAGLAIYSTHADVERLIAGVAALSRG